jgi:hypothetical protein
MGNGKRTRKSSREYARVPPLEGTSTGDGAPELDVDDPSFSLDSEVTADEPGTLPGAPRARRDSIELVPSAAGSWPRLDPPPEPEPRKPANPEVSDMRDRYAMGDFSGALLVANNILARRPDDPDALRYAQSCREILIQMFAARLGPFDQVPKMALPREEIRWLSLDHRAGFLLSLVDGICTIEQLLDLSSMPRLDALRILHTLLEQRVISLGGGARR